MNNNLYIFPTDTVYGIGTGLYNKKGIKELYEIKGRDFNKPISVLCCKVEVIENFAVMTDDAKLLAKKFWPGGLTLILKTNERYKRFSNEDTVGVRIPNHETALKLLRTTGPLKTSSVNKSGEEPLNDYNLIKEKYDGLVKEILKNDEKIDKVSSTVVSLIDGVKLIREGNIKFIDILSVLKVNN